MIKLRMSCVKIFMFIFIFTFLLLNIIFYVYLQYPCDSFYGNSKKVKSVTKASYPDPIDVVYTWVNGSDSKLLSQLNVHKRGLYLDRNLHLDGSRHRLNCPYPICGFDNHILLSPIPPPEVDIKDFLYRLSNDFQIILNCSINVTAQFVARIEKSEITRRSGIIVHMSVDISSLFIYQSDIKFNLTGFNETSLTLSQVFIAAEANNVGIPVDRYCFIYDLKEMKEANMESAWRDIIQKRTSMNISMVKASSTSFLVNLHNGVNYTDFALQLTNKSFEETFQISKAFLIVDTGLATVFSDLSESRYQDNEELRYSLRSLDSFLGFYRHIFLVTNGQVPSWLDTENPRITLISHSQIFPNKSHLPTFNSAAIEANLCNIPGLAPHFIYLNDDVFFGKPVYEEDFISLSSGYKVYLGWSVPDCVERCPNAWLADGFCDHECNVPECHWDAGDCIKTHGKVGSINFASMVNQSLGHMQHFAALSQTLSGSCSQGCNHNWLADRYCDSSCNVVDCGYDLGDCGDTNLLSLPSAVSSISSGELFPVENGTRAFVLNLRSLISMQDNVTKAVIDDVEEVLASSYTIKYRLLVVLLKQGKVADRVININVTVYNGSVFKVNIVTGLVLNVNTTAGFNRHSITTASLSSTTPLTFLTNFNYRSPRNITFYNPLIDSNVSINELEWNRPMDMSHYRLLLQDGLISLAGYRHLVQQLWTSIKSPNIRNISLTAPNSPLRLEHLSWGFLPWERNWHTRLRGPHTASSAFYTSDSFTTHHSRRPLDLYAESLRHSNRLLSNIFGISQRRVPAHGPHFISSSIFKAAHDMFDSPWLQTSGHKFRTPFDLQFAFTYFYFLMSEKKNVTVADVLKSVDTDISGTLNGNELRSLALILGKNDSISDLSMNEFIKQIRNGCKWNETSDRKFFVNVTELSTCLNISDSRPDSVIPRYPFTTLDDGDVMFIMISSNRNKVLKDLDTLRKRPKKFFCLNDNLAAKGDLVTVETVRRDLKDFLEFMFPSPSQFEKSLRKSTSLSTSSFLMWVSMGIFMVSLVLARFLLKKIVFKGYHIFRWVIFRDSTAHHSTFP